MSIFIDMKNIINKWFGFLMSRNSIFLLGGIAIIIGILLEIFGWTRIMTAIADFFAYYIMGVLLGGSALVLFGIAIYNVVKKKK